MTNKIVKQLDDLIIITLNEITKNHEKANFKKLKDMIKIRSELKLNSSDLDSEKISEQDLSIIKDFIRNTR